MKKILLSLVVLAAPFFASARTVTFKGDKSAKLKKGDTVVVRQPADQLDFTILPGGVMTVLISGQTTYSGHPRKATEKLWEFVVNRDMQITIKKGKPITYKYN